MAAVAIYMLRGCVYLHNLYFNKKKIEERIQTMKCSGICAFHALLFCAARVATWVVTVCVLVDEIATMVFGKEGKGGGRNT